MTMQNRYNVIKHLYKHIESCVKSKPNLSELVLFDMGVQQWERLTHFCLIHISMTYQAYLIKAVNPLKSTNGFFPLLFDDDLKSLKLHKIHKIKSLVDWLVFNATLAIFQLYRDVKVIGYCSFQLMLINERVLQ
jgi:hypothetical protein